MKNGKKLNNMDVFSYLLGKKAGGGGGGGEGIAHPGYVNFNGYNGTTLDFSWLRTDNITDMKNMFANIPNLATPLDLSKFDTKNVTSMEAMFSNSGGKNFKGIDFTQYPNFKTNNVTAFSNMFYSFGYGNANTDGILDVSTFEMSQATYVSNMFGSAKLKKIILPENLSLPRITNLSYFFSSQSYTTEIENIDSMDVSNIIVFSYMFQNCLELANPDFSNWDVSSARTSNGLNNMFNNVPLLTDASLNSILKMLQTAPSNYVNKTLKDLGFSSSQATTMTSLSNWDDLEALGWSTGY